MFENALPDQHNKNRSTNKGGYSMRDQKSQQGSEGEDENREKVKRKKGHMALRNNVYDLKLELWHILKPFEYYLVDVIIDKTIKWREKEARITIEELEARTGQRRDYVYIALKALEDKQIIIRRKIRHDWIIGLNEDYFGGVLIKRHEDVLQARKARIKIVPEQPKIQTKIQSNLDLKPVQSELMTSPVETGIQSENDIQGIESIGETRSLNTLLKDISLKTSLQTDKTQESFTPSIKKTETKKVVQLKNHQDEAKRQILAAQAAGIL